MKAIYERDFIPLSAHQSEIQMAQCKTKMLQAMKEETYLCSKFMCCHYDFTNGTQYQSISGKKIEAVIKHNDVQGVDYFTVHQIPKTKLNKHLSINLRQVYYKKIKKVKQIRNFFRPKSVFAEFRLDTEKKLEDGFELDK